MKKLLIIITIFFLFQTTWSLGITEDEATKLYQKAYSNVLDKNWQQAIDQFEELLQKYRGSSWEDDAEFWLCYSNGKKSGDLEQAFNCMENFVNSFEDSKWRDDALQNMTKLAQQLEEEGKTEYMMQLKTIENDVNDELTLAAIRALSSRGDEKAFNSILKIYDSNKNARIRKKMVYIIGSFETEASSKKLMDIAVNDPEEEIRSEAVFWLSDNKPTKEIAQFLYDRALNDKATKVQKKAIFTLSEMDNNYGLSYLIKVAQNHKNEDMRADAVFWIGEQAESDDDIKRLSEFAQNDKAEKVRKKAIFALAEAKPAAAADELIRLSKELKDPDSRANAIFWLSQNDVSKKHIEAIRNAAYNDEDEKVQEKAVFALYELEDNKGLDDLIEIAKNHPSIHIRKKAIFWLGETGDERAVNALEEILLSPNK